MGSFFRAGFFKRFFFSFAEFLRSLERLVAFFGVPAAVLAVEGLPVHAFRGFETARTGRSRAPRDHRVEDRVPVAGFRVRGADSGVQAAGGLVPARARGCVVGPFPGPAVLVPAGGARRAGGGTWAPGRLPSGAAAPGVGRRDAGAN